MTSPDTCGTCHGKGAVNFHHVDRDAQGAMVMSSRGSHLCQCRRDLRPREGKARWWSTEIVHREDWQSVCGTVTATFEVEVEVPIDAENYRVYRTGENVYYPAVVNVTLDRAEMPLLMADDLLALARTFQRCHDKILKLDAPEVVQT